MTSRLHSLRDELVRLGEEIGRPVRFMEVCGTHTMSSFRNGLPSVMPANLRLISGPGCPVCVTAQRHIDAAIELAAKDGVIIATYGDMLRVPGRLGSLESRRARGGQVRVVNSARTALEIARREPAKKVVFLGVGFETTAPATAATVLEAAGEGLDNFSVLMCHKRIVPAMMALLEDGEVPLDGFLCPGHVSVVIGSSAYHPVVERYGKACVVAGFEPEQMLLGLVHLARQVLRKRRNVESRKSKAESRKSKSESRKAKSESRKVGTLERRDCETAKSGDGATLIPRLENVYPAVVSETGNRVALELLERVFVVSDTAWRALGTIPRSGFELAPAYQRFDALRRFGLTLGEDEEHPECRCGEVIQGKAEPTECPLFDNGCTPLAPIGPCMVSTEGTCAAWYKYWRETPKRRSGRAEKGFTAQRNGKAES